MVLVILPMHFSPKSMIALLVTDILVCPWFDHWPIQPPLISYHTYIRFASFLCTCTPIRSSRAFVFDDEYHNIADVVNESLVIISPEISSHMMQLYTTLYSVGLKTNPWGVFYYDSSVTLRNISRLEGTPKYSPISHLGVFMVFFTFRLMMPQYSLWLQLQNTPWGNQTDGIWLDLTVPLQDFFRWV